MKNLLLILFFLLGSLSNNAAIAMTSKISYSISQNLNSLPKDTKKTSVTRFFDKKIKTMKGFTLPTRYIVNTIVMTAFQLKNSVFVKKSKGNWTDYLMVFALLVTFGLTTYFFIWLGEVLIVALLAGIASVVGLLFLVVLWAGITGNIRC